MHREVRGLIARETGTLRCLIAVLAILLLGVIGAEAEEPATSAPSQAPDRQSAVPSSPSEQAPASESATPPPAAQPPANENAAPANPPIPSNATVLDKDEIQGVLGKKVLSPT